MIVALCCILVTYVVLMTKRGLEACDNGFILTSGALLSFLGVILLSFIITAFKRKVKSTARVCFREGGLCDTIGGKISPMRGATEEGGGEEEQRHVDLEEGDE